MIIILDLNIGLLDFEKIILQEATGEDYRHFTIDILDVEDVVKKNNIQEITNPVFFDMNNRPTSDGLLSNEIFGITMDDRAKTFGYVNLHEPFIHPLHYDTLCRLDSNIKSLVHGTEKFSIDKHGYLIKDKDGETGIKFLYKIRNDLKFKPSDSNSRKELIQFIYTTRNEMFIKKFIVIPPFYRDVDTKTDGFVGVGEINKLYASLIISVRGLKESSDYGLTVSDSMRGRIQETILSIYLWFKASMAKKTGLIRRAALNKTTDFSQRLVMSSAKLDVETMDDMMVTMDRSALPLSAVLGMYLPFILFTVRRIFENEFAGKTYFDVYIKETKRIEKFKLKNTAIEFSDERIKKEISRFLHGMKNRFIPIELPIENPPKGGAYLYFKGRNVLPEEYEKRGPDETGIVNRKLTWCDIFYIAASEVVKNKAILITRYPIDSAFNQFPNKIIVSSTKETEPMILDVLNREFYQFYPKIRAEDIGSDTSNKFIDTCTIANPYTGAMDLDFDGDTSKNSGAYTVEANEELLKQINNPSNFISLSGEITRKPAKEGLQSLYALTLVLPGTELIDPIF